MNRLEQLAIQQGVVDDAVQLQVRRTDEKQGGSVMNEFS